MSQSQLRTEYSTETHRKGNQNKFDAMRQCAYLDIPMDDALDLLQRTTLSDLQKLEAALVPMKRSPKAHKDC